MFWGFGGLAKDHKKYVFFFFGTLPLQYCQQQLNCLGNDCQCFSDLLSHSVKFIFDHPHFWIPKLADHSRKPNVALNCSSPNDSLLVLCSLVLSSQALFESPHSVSRLQMSTLIKISREWEPCPFIYWDGAVFGQPGRGGPICEGRCRWQPGSTHMSARPNWPIRRTEIWNLKHWKYGICRRKNM